MRLAQWEVEDPGESEWRDAGRKWDAEEEEKEGQMEARQLR